MRKRNYYYRIPIMLVGLQLLVRGGNFLGDWT